MSHPTITSETIATCDTALDLHTARTVDDLRDAMLATLHRLTPQSDAAVLFAEDDSGRRRVELARGPSCPLATGDVVEPDAWSEPGLVRLPLHYAESELGEMLLRGPLGDTVHAQLDVTVRHYVVALVNLKLNAETLHGVDHYYASLQAMQEGIGLFQEQDKETISARFLRLMTSVLGTQPGALYLLEEPGNPASPLQLDQALGVPDALLDQLCLADGTWWPQTVVGEPPRVLARGPDGVLPVLDNDRVPPAVTSIVTSPLRYDGLTVGVGLVFNSDTVHPSFEARRDSVGRLGELGAVIFHRLRLEQVALRSQEVETQLGIASRIQARLLPASCPDWSGVDCAWSSRPAQHIGGDYLDLLDGHDDEFHAVIADVSGHGINSALLMTSFRATYRAECLHREPSDLLAKLNSEIDHETGDTGMFVTAAALKVRTDGSGARYASAGHNPLFLYRAATGDVEELDSTGPSLGFFAGVDYDCGEVALQPGDILLLYTDGIVEALAPNDEFAMFGDDRLKGLLIQHAGAPAQEILDAVLHDLQRFTAADTYDDDVSLTVIKVRTTAAGGLNSASTS